MRRLFLGVALAAAVAAAHANPSVSAYVTCGNNAPGVYQTGDSPVVRVLYGTGTDAGKPGMFFFALLSPDKKYVNVMDSTGTWKQYFGGLYPPYQRYDAGMPASISVNVPLPNGPLTTSNFAGYTVYVGHGVLTQQALGMVADRRAALNQAKPQRVAAGTWRTEYEDDTNMKWSLVQKDMTDNSKWGPAITVPYVDCAPPPPPTQQECLADPNLSGCAGLYPTTP